MTTPEKIWLENIRNHQIGGQTDGIDWEVAADLGFKPPSEVLLNQSAQPLGQAALDNSLKANNDSKKPFRPTRGIKEKTLSPRTQALHDEINARIRRNADAWGIDLGGI